MDPVILAAIITASGGVVAAIITAIVACIKKKGGTATKSNTKISQNVSGDNNTIIGVINNQKEKTDVDE